MGSWGFCVGSRGFRGVGPCKRRQAGRGGNSPDAGQGQLIVVVDLDRRSVGEMSQLIAQLAIRVSVELAKTGEEVNRNLRLKSQMTVLPVSRRVEVTIGAERPDTHLRGCTGPGAGLLLAAAGCCTRGHCVHGPPSCGGHWQAQVAGSSLEMEAGSFLFLIAEQC